MPIVPDTKNWTWVLTELCPECGFHGGTISAPDVQALLRTNATLWPALLTHPAARVRPTDDQWSALEYGCHVRDVFVLYDERLRLMLEHDGPHFENWDQDVTAIEDRYDLQDPEVVAGEVLAKAIALADRFATIRPDQLQRTGFRSDGQAFTIDSFSRYFIHDPLHHVHDVLRGYNAIADRA